MIREHPDRRTLICALAAAGVAGAARSQPTGPERTELDISGRKVPLYLWRAAETRAAVVFSHGAGADPRGYHRLFDLWRTFGISVAAPVHVDSELNPDQNRYTLASAFVPRWRDVNAAVAEMREQFSGVKIGAAGHSYGSLFALMMAGGLPSVFAPPKTPVDAVVAFSSPGKISLVRPESYAKVVAPFLQFTGDQDRVEGAVSDWRDHLYAFETSMAGDKYAWVGKGVDHGFGGALHGRPSQQDPQFAEALALSAQFLRAYLEQDRDARLSLTTRADTSLAHFARR